ncbi:MAG: prepilin-type N-terminal cleavage/methylation domain-containing protein [Candidatus Omnitrophica bacterium]|nr:prepilin-type N-terminal cleavage/methylation domain-containing protein [Candidatus Omnitrophota bacterium]
MKIRRGTRGFTILEIVVVVAVIAILCTIAIPNLLRGRMNSTESVVLGSCQTIGKACQNFYSHVQPHTYPDSLAQLAGLTPAYIDPLLGSGMKQGYQFLYNRPDPEHYTLMAQPVTLGINGNRFFFLDESGVLRARHGQAAGPADPPVE